MSGTRVVTALRARPLSANEISSGAVNILSYDSVSKGIGITHPSSVGSTKGDMVPERVFNYDHAFWSVYKSDPFFSSQEAVFNEVGKPILENCLKGINCSLFAYGQTGSGKTYTMMGSNDVNDENAGLIPRICRAILGELASKDLNIEGSVERLISAKVFVSFLEIYNEKVFDLLSPTSNVTSRVREHPQSGAYVENLTKVRAGTFGDILQILSDGKRKRQVASTLMNSESSRSHAVFTIYVVQTICSTTEFERSSKVSLVDLAGSERVNNSGVTGDRLKEASNINKSLSTLGDVINALSEKSSGNSDSTFIPYRNSTLTWLLKDSLGGNSKTFMLATISPCDASYGESMSTLRYLERAKLIVNNVSINESHWENPQVALLQKQLSELNAKYVALMKQHQTRESEFEATLNRIKADFEQINRQRLEELEQYIGQLEHELGGDAVAKLKIARPVLGPAATSQSFLGADLSAAPIDGGSVVDIQNALTTSLSLSEPVDVDLNAIINRFELSIELQGAVSDMLTVVTGEEVAGEDCGQAAAVFASVMEKHFEPLKTKYTKLAERHRLLESWHSAERASAASKNEQIDMLTKEITDLRRTVFRSHSFAEEPSILATINEGEALTFEETDPACLAFQPRTPVRGEPTTIENIKTPPPSLTREPSSGANAATVIHKLEDELAEAIISAQKHKKMAQEQSEIFAIEAQLAKDNLAKVTLQLDQAIRERNNMSNSVLDVNNMCAAIEANLKAAQKELRQQNAKFSDLLRAKDNEIALLTERANGSEAKLVDLEGNFKKEISILESHLKAQTKAVMMLKAEKETVHRNLTKELDTTLQGTDAAQLVLRQEIEKLQAQLEVVTSQLDSEKEDRECDAANFLTELDNEELKFKSAKKQWKADAAKLTSEINYLAAELENTRAESSVAIDELRDALMSQCEVHKKYEVEKENEISILKTWLEEAQADLEDMSTSKTIELNALIESSSKFKAEAEAELNTKNNEIDELQAQVDKLTSKCSEWNNQYAELYLRSDTWTTKYHEIEMQKREEIEALQDDFKQILEEREDTIAALEVKYEALLKIFEENKANKELELAAVRDELSIQLVKYGMLEIDELTEMDSMKELIKKLEDTHRLKCELSDKEINCLNLELTKLKEEYGALESQKNAEIELLNKDINELRAINYMVKSDSNNAVESMVALRLQDEKQLWEENMQMGVEELRTCNLLLEAERKKMREVYLSASSAIRGVEYDAESLSDESLAGVSVLDDVAESVNMEETGNFGVKNDTENATKVAEANNLNMQVLASAILSFLKTPSDLGAPVRESLDRASQCDTAAQTPVSVTAPERNSDKWTNTEQLQQHSNLEDVDVAVNKVKVMYERTFSDLKDNFETKTFAMETAKELQDAEMAALHKEITELKSALQSRNSQASIVSHDDTSRGRGSAIAAQASEPPIMAVAEPFPMQSTALSASAGGSRVPPAVGEQNRDAPRKPKRKSFWSCASVDEAEVVNPTTELPRR